MNKGSIGFTCSCFDLLHAGHILMLKDAKEQCDYLIVGLQTDPTLDRPEKNKPIQSLEERKIQLEAVKYVDEIRIYSTEAELRDMLCEIWPSVRILGSDYITKDNLPVEEIFQNSIINLLKKFVNGCIKRNSNSTC